MKKLMGCLLAGCALAGTIVPARGAQNMTGTASISVTSDTAAIAKTMALAEARRQIVRDVLGQYSDAVQLDMLMSNAPDDDLTLLIAKSKIDNEQQSATTYSANITMTLEQVAVRDWLNNNGVQNWLGDSTTADRIPVFIRPRNGLIDWAELNTMARGAGITLDTRHLDATRIIVEIPAGNRGMLTALARDAGWRYSDENGILTIWK